MDSKEIEKLLKDYKKGEDNTEWLIGLVLIMALFSDNSAFGSKSKTDELDKRISKLEGKTELIENIILK